VPRRAGIATLLILIVSLPILFSCGRQLSVNREPYLSANFMLYDSEGPNMGGAYALELGINTLPIYFDDWAAIETTEGTFNWAPAIPDDTSRYKHCLARLGILHVLAWNSPDNIPIFADRNDLDGTFKIKYERFIRNAVGELKARRIPVDAYIVEQEANFAGHELASGNRTNQWIIDWIKWEAALIKGLDPGARIILPFVPTEFHPNETLDNTGDLGKILVSDFMARLISSEVQFNAMSFSIASGAYDKVDDWTVLNATLEAWCARFDKEVYVWALGYPADNADHLFFNYPRAGGYSEEWQKEQYVNSLKLLLDNPKVIGVSIDLFDYQESGLAAPFHFGLVSGTSTGATHTKRPAFDAVKEYWQKNYR